MRYAQLCSCASVFKTGRRTRQNCTITRDEIPLSFSFSLLLSWNHFQRTVSPFNYPGGLTKIRQTHALAPSHGGVTNAAETNASFRRSSGDGRGKSLACIARSSEQQRAIYGITPMINGTAGSRHPSTLFSTLLSTPLPLRSFLFSFSFSFFLPLSLFLSPFSACPAAYVCGLRQRATSHWPTLGPNGLRGL